jgi:hypothetical protein
MTNNSKSHGKKNGKCKCKRVASGFFSYFKSFQKISIPCIIIEVRLLQYPTAYGIGIRTFKTGSCGEPAISLHSHYVSLVQWTNPLLPVTRDPGSNPLGGLM